MRIQNVSVAMVFGALVIAPLSGCASGPKTPLAHQPPVQANPDTATPAAAAVADKDKTPDDGRPVHALIGHSLGAGGGFVCGVGADKIEFDKQEAKDAAIKASQRAEKNPAKPEDVEKAPTADLNADGFVTLDEIVALRQAELNDHEILDRLSRTHQVFDLTEYQQDYLRTRGVSDNVIKQLPALNHAPAGTDVAAAATGRD